MLTICLVTQGREQVQEFINSAAPFGNLEFINFVVFDNGAPPNVRELLKNWSAIQPRTTYIRKQKNTTDFNEIWALIEEHASEWINFPGDDDRLILEGYLEFRNLVTQSAEFSAIAMSARIIDSTGKPTGEMIGPGLKTGMAKASQVALSLNSPPFFWPALFINKNYLCSSFPKSRFVLDWWISLHLIFEGHAIVSNESSVEYRRHSSQESAQVTLNRKFFEASFYFDDLISSNKFAARLNSLSDLERLNFWNTASENLPIYGDPEFGRLVLFRLAKVLINSFSGSELNAKILADISQKYGVFYHDESLSEILVFPPNSNHLFGNVRLTNDNLSCPYLEFVLSSFVGNQNSIAVEISCAHMNSGPESIHLDCKHYEFLTYSQKTDRLVVEIATELELQGKVEFRISPRERALIKLLRRIKPMISGKLLMKIKKRHDR